MATSRFLKTAFMLALLVILHGRCTNNNLVSYSSHGTITGIDLRYCICCGGYIIQIDNNNYLFHTLPSNSGIDLGTVTYPIHVLLNWKANSTGCTNVITITDIKQVPG